MGEVDEINYEESDYTPRTHRSEKSVVEQRFEDGGEGGFGYDTYRDTRSRDADLTGSKVDLKIMSHTPCSFECGVAVEKLLLVN